MKFLNKIFWVVVVIHLSSAEAQVTGTPSLIPAESRYLSEAVATNSSFALSTRKLRQDYTGFALRVRRNTDNAEADIAFDSNNIVSNESTVTIAVVGTSGLSLGATMTLASFRASATMFVSIWYDQGTNGYNGVQNTTAAQPVLTMASAGINNQYASVVFNGPSRQSVVINQPLNILLTNSLRGSMGMVAKTTASGVTAYSFGYLDTITPNNRWFLHMNWSDNYLYSDFGYALDGGARAFDNSANTNKYKQFTFIRTTNTKTVKVSKVFKINAMGQNTTTAPYLANVAVSSFGVGCNSGYQYTGTPGYSGNVAEFILYPDALTTAQTDAMETNQLLFWGCN